MEIIEENKKQILIALGLIVLIVVFLIIKGCVSKSKKIYTIESTKTSKLPYINLKIDDVKTINRELKEDYYIIKNLKNESTMNYEYNISNDLLSVLVKEVIYVDNRVPVTRYVSYNIDLKNKKVLTKDDVYSKYSLSKTSIESMLDSTMERQYNKDIQNGYINNSFEYDYYIQEFRQYHGIDDLEIYVKSNKVYGYLNVRDYTPNADKKKYSNMNKEYTLN